MVVFLLHYAACMRCEVKDCIRCGPYFAECETNDFNRPIPQELNSSIQTMYINYNGSQNVELNNGLFKKFRNLTTVYLTGNFRTLTNSTFQGLDNLTSVTIYKSSLSRIDSDAFGHNTSTVQKLNLTGTQLTRIPVHTFHSLPNLQTMDLSGNLNMLVCNKDMVSIGKEFKLLPSLSKLVLDRVGANTPCNTTADYFEPISHIIDLRLSHTGFFMAGPKILTTLTKLESLSMSAVNPFKGCPRKAKELFTYMPKTLVNLKVHDWKTYDVMNESCTIDEETLLGLKKLPNLRSLEFRYSDKVFGERITKNLFQNFSALEKLDLGWCSFNSIATGAFTGLKLKELKLNMNQLGSREFWPFGSDSRNLTSEVESLELSHCGIVAIKYYASFIAKSFPKLNFLDLSNNMLQYLPVFYETSYQPPNSGITRFNIARNMIRALSGDAMNQICNLMPNLQILSAYSNHISELSDLCISLTSLSLDHNLIWKNADQNFQAIALLKNLEYLDLDTNNLSYVRPGMFDNMVELRILLLSGNQLKHIDDQTLRYNRNLAELYLMSNKINMFNVSLLENTKKLKLLFISTNYITTFNRSFVEFMENRNETLTSLKISENPFDCSCGHEYFRDWLYKTKSVHNSVGLECATPENMAQKKVYNYKEPPFECKIKEPLIWTSVVVGLVLMTILIVVPCYRYRWYVSHAVIVLQAVKDRAMDIKHSDECKYDAMICSDNNNEADMKFVRVMLQHLEGGVFPAIDSMSLHDEDERVCFM